MLFEKITTLCKDKKITIAKLERECAMGNGTVRGWKNSSPSVENLKKVADYFGVNVDELLATEEKWKKESEYDFDSVTVKCVCNISYIKRLQTHWPYIKGTGRWHFFSMHLYSVKICFDNLLKIASKFSEHSVREYSGLLFSASSKSR